MRTPFILLLAPLLAGCAGGDAARDMAKTSAGLMQQFGSETQAFFGQQNDLARDAAESVAYRNRTTAALRAGNRLGRAAWAAEGKDDAAEIYDALTVNGPEDLMRSSVELDSLNPADAGVVTTIDAKAFSNLVSGLKKLAEKPSFKDRAVFLFKEGKAVYDGYKKSLDDAQALGAEAATAPAPTP